MYGLRDHVRSWSDDISIDSLVRDLTQYAAVLGFGIGLVFGFTFDTSGPSAHAPFGRPRRAAAFPAGGAAPPPPATPPSPHDDVAEDREPVTAGPPPNMTRPLPPGRDDRDPADTDRPGVSAALESRTPSRLDLLLAHCAEVPAARRPVLERLGEKLGAELAGLLLCALAGGQRARRPG
jgi:hypothetical protein